MSGKLSEIAPKFYLGGSTFAPITFLFVDQSLPTFFSSNVGGIVVDHLLFDFRYVRSVPEIIEILAIEVDSYQKSRRILDVFLHSQILGGGPSPKVVPTLTPLPRGTSHGKFVTLFPLAAKL